MGYGDRVRALLRGCWLAFGRGISRPGGAKAYMANAVVRHRCALGPGPGLDVAPGTHRSVGGRERTRPRAGTTRSGGLQCRLACLRSKLAIHAGGWRGDVDHWRGSTRQASPPILRLGLRVLRVECRGCRLICEAG